MTNKNLRTRISKEKWVPDKNLLPIMFGKEVEEREELGKKEKEKIALFEKGLANGLRKDDTIEQAVKKIVNTALAAEFGSSLPKAKGAEGMISSITRGILSDDTLRKQALVIIDRFAKIESS